MADPTRLTITVTHTDGTTSRWAADEPSVENVPGQLRFGSTIPGGYSTCEFSLPRSISKVYNDESLFDDVKVTGPGGQVAWEGRVARLPREHSDRPNLTVGCVGHSARLRDDSTFMEIYVDHDKSKWVPVSAQRQSVIIAAGYACTGPELAQDSTTGAPALWLGGKGTATTTAALFASGMYNSGGIPIGSLYYYWSKSSTIDAGLAGWQWTANLSTTDTSTSRDTTGNLKAVGPAGGTITATTATRIFGVLELFWPTGTATGTTNVDYGLWWSCLAIYGRHGLTKRGTATATIGQGFYASDIISDVLTRQCPELAQSIEATSYSIPQATYLEPTTAEDVLLDVNRFHNFRWGVFSGKTFRYWSVNQAAATTWEARLADGARLALEGDDSSDVYNAVIVRYTDVDGVQRSAGPTWASNVDYTDSALETTGDAATAHGIRRCAVITITGALPNSDADGTRPAVQIGRLWLAEQALPDRKGSISVTGTIEHPTEGQVPVWRITAGDFIRVSDRPGDVAREITNVEYDHESRTATLSVGGLPLKVDAMLDMFNTQLTAAGF